MPTHPDLAELLRLDAVTYDAVGPAMHGVVAQDAAAGDGVPVDGYEDVLTQAVLTVGARDAAAFAPLLPAAVGHVARLDAEDPDGVQPHLGVLGVLNLLDVQGVAVPAATWATARAWLPGMPTAHAEPPAWHWERGLAALALGDLATARTVAGLPERGALDVDPARDPGLSAQAWLALLVGAVEGGWAWADVAPRWEQLLDVVPVLVEVEELTEADLAWLARILRHDVAGAPLGEVADWLHAEAYRVAGLGAG